MMHLNPHLLSRLSTNATRFSQFGPRTHSLPHPYLIDRGVAACLKGITLLGPIMVEVETHHALFPSFWTCHSYFQIFAVAFEDGPHGYLAFLGQRFRQGMLQNVLDSGEFCPIIDEAVVVLEAAIDAAVQSDYLFLVEMGPGSFCHRLTLHCADASLLQSFHDFRQRRVHFGLPTRASAGVLFPVSVGDMRNLGFSSCSEAQERSQKMRFFRSGVRDPSLFLIQAQFQPRVQVFLHSLFDGLSKALTPVYPDDPVICVPEILDPDEFGVIDQDRGKSPSIFHEFPIFPGFGLALSSQKQYVSRDTIVLRVLGLAFPFLLLLSEMFNKLVQFVEIDVGKNGANNAPLW